MDLQEKDKNFLNETELLQEVNTFMFGVSRIFVFLINYGVYKFIIIKLIKFTSQGYDTVASGIGWVMFHLGNEPEVQEIVHQELDEIFGDSKEPATMNQILELKYLERVIKESFRAHSPGPTIARRLTEDIELGDHQHS